MPPTFVLTTCKNKIGQPVYIAWEGRLLGQITWRPQEAASTIAMQ